MSNRYLQSIMPDLKRGHLEVLRNSPITVSQALLSKEGTTSFRLLLFIVRSLLRFVHDHLSREGYSTLTQTTLTLIESSLAL